MPRTVLTPPQGRDSVPDVCNFSWAEYGIRCGLPRLIDLFRRLDIPVSASVNLDVLTVYREAADAMLEAGWDFIGHGVRQRSVAADTEAEQIAEVARTMAAFTGQPLRGWLSPGLRQTVDTPDILARNGITHCLDWGIDDRPCWMHSAAGPIMAMPYSMELNDSVVFAVQNNDAADFGRRIDDTTAFFDASPSETGPIVVGVGLHPHLIAVPHRMLYFMQALDRLSARNDVAFMTARSIADWYADQCPPDRFTSR